MNYYHKLSSSLKSFFWNLASKNEGLYLRLKYWRTMGAVLHLSHPRLYSEKLQWLKLHYRRNIMSVLVDKASVKDYVSHIVGSDYVIPTIGIWDNVSDIPWESLPDSFVLKCTHDSGGVIVCKDKRTLNIEKAKQLLTQRMSSSYYEQNKEWPYKNVKPRIICEQYIGDGQCSINDYKWFCFNGVPKLLFIATDRDDDTTETKFDFFDMSFNHLDIINGHPCSSVEINKPVGFEEMKKIAGRLSQGFPHVRIDLYDVAGKVYFGEYTFYHWGGFVPFEPKSWDGILGQWLELPQKPIVEGE